MVDPDSAAAWDAFLSYSHDDARVAERIHAFLQEFPLPPRAGTTRRRLQIFRDRTDIRARKLGDELPSAIARSSTLLVICSRSASASGWVNREVESFLTAGRGEVIPLLVSGDMADALPVALRGYEPLVLDLREGWRFGRPRSATRLELLRAVAGIADVPLRELIPWDLQRRRQRALVGLGLAAAVVATVAVVVVGWLLERRGAESLAGHRRAQGALVQLTSGDAARAVATLGHVISTSGNDFEQEYGDVLRFWIDRLEPIDRVVALANHAVLRQAGRSFFVLGPHDVREIVAEEPFEAVLVGSDRLLIIGRNEVRVLTLPEMAVTVAQSFPTRLTFEGAALDASERIAVIAASQVETTNDEDEPTIVHPCHAALVLPDAGRASVSAQGAAKTPDTVNESEALALKIRQRNANGEALVSSCFISAEELNPSGAAAASTVDVPAELQAVQPLLPPQGIDSPSLRRLTPLRQINFPRIQPEAELWQKKPQPNTPPGDRRSSVPPAFDEALRQLKAAPDADFNLAPHVGDLDDCLVGCGVFQTDTGVVVWSVTVSGNSYVHVTHCTLPNASASPTCQPDRAAFVAINARQMFSADGRWMLTVSNHLGAPSVELFDILLYKRIKLSPQPPGQVLSGAFAAAPEGLYLLTENDELWQFSPAVETWTFTRRIQVGTVSDESDGCRRTEQHDKVKSIATLPIVTFNSGIVVTVSKSCMLVAADASTGELRWRVPISRPGAEEWIQLTCRADSNVVVATVGSRLRLFHVTTGAPLSELIDIKDLFGDSLQNHFNIQVESSGAILVGSQSEEVTVRRAPPDRDTYRGVLQSLQNWTGISVSDGRTSIVTLPAK